MTFCGGSARLYVGLARLYSGLSVADQGDSRLGDGNKGSTIKRMPREIAQCCLTEKKYRYCMRPNQIID